MSYEEFGRRFFEVAVSEERVADAIGGIAGEAFDMGPIAQGPGGLAKVTARVQKVIAAGRYVLAGVRRDGYRGVVIAELGIGGRGIVGLRLFAE